MLRNKLPAIMNHLRIVYENQVIYNFKVIEIFNGQLLKYVEESLRVELTGSSYEKARTRIPPINVIKQFVDKVNRTYDEAATRSLSVDNAIDKDLLDNAQKNLDIDTKMDELGDYLTLNKYGLIELYASEGKEQMRIIPASQFIVYSDDKYNPNKATVIIKLMGRRNKSYLQHTDEHGRTLQAPTEIVRDVEFYHIWDRDTFLEVDADGDVTIEQENAYGKLPFIYVREKEIELMPSPDCDMLQMAVVLPKLLTDVNYAVQFQSHSIMYGIDINHKNLEIAPDVFWELSSIDRGDQKIEPKIGTITPSVDSDKALNNYKVQFSLWLESKGVKIGSIDSQQRSASGYSKAIDESDTTSLRKERVRLMSGVERKFWALYKEMRPVWVAQGLLEDTRLCSDDFEVSVQFAEQKPMIDTKTVLEELKLMFDMGIITIKMALKKLYPEKTDQEIEKMYEEIKAEKAENVAQAQAQMAAQSGEINNSEEDNTEEDNGEVE